MPPRSAAFSSEASDAFAAPDANFAASGISGFTFAISFGPLSSVLIPNKFLKKSFIPVKIFEIVSVMGERKSEMD